MDEDPLGPEQHRDGKVPPRGEDWNDGPRRAALRAIAGAVTAATGSTARTLEFLSASRSTPTTIATIGGMARGGWATTGTTGVALYDGKECGASGGESPRSPAPQNLTRKK
jgi:hypothetical protein